MAATSGGPEYDDGATFIVLLKSVQYMGTRWIPISTNRSSGWNVR
jgi:hypothetical protein